MLKFYIINLARSPERRKSVIKNLEKFGIKNYEFVEGLDASFYSTEQLNHLIDKQRLERPLPNGMIGCAIGHIKAVRKFLKDSEATYGVILEDDFLLHSSIEEVIANINSEVLDLGPVLLYGYIKNSLIFEENMKLTSVHSLFNVKDTLQIWSALGYMLNKKTAAKLLHVIYPIKDVPDSWGKFQEWGAFEKLFIIYPFVLSHEVFNSSRSKKNHKLVDRVQKLVNHIIQKQTPVLYQIIKSYRFKHTKSHTNLIEFKFLKG